MLIVGPVLPREGRRALSHRYGAAPALRSHSPPQAHRLLFTSNCVMFPLKKNDNWDLAELPQGRNDAPF